MVDKQVMLVEMEVLAAMVDTVVLLDTQELQVDTVMGEELARLVWEEVVRVDEEVAVVSDTMVLLVCQDSLDILLLVDTVAAVA